MWRVYLHDWAGAALGELTDVRDLKLNVGLNKTSNLTFQTALQSPTSKQLADRDYSIITAYRWNPYTNQWSLQFSGPIISTEENGDEGVTTIGVTAVGAFWRLSKRVADNADGEGRTQAGLAPAPEDTYIYIADRIGNRVVVMDAATNTQVRTFGTSGSGNGQLTTPKGLDVDAANNRVYVADSGNHRIHIFTTTGTYVGKWGGTAASSASTGFSDPQDVAVDNSGNVWVADRGNRRVLKYSTSGSLLLTINYTTANPLRGLTHINMTDDGNVIVATDDATDQRGWYLISPSGTFLSSFLGQMREALKQKNEYYWTNATGSALKLSSNGSQSTISSSGLVQSMQRGSDGTIWLLESNATNTSQIRKYTAAGILSSTISAWGTGSGQTRNATGFAVAKGAPRDAITIASELITDSNTNDGNTWIRTASSQGTSSSIYISKGTWGGFKKISEAIDDLSAAFEWKVTPKNTTDGTGLVLGEWYANSTLGSTKSAEITFEFNTGKNNATDYSIKRSLEGLLNQASYPAAETNPYSVVVSDGTDITEHGLIEEIITGSLISEDLRRKVAELYLLIRKNPRVLVEITPDRSDLSGPTNRRVSIPLLDYEPGDVVGLAIEDNGVERIPASEARIYDITVEVDAQGKEEAKINLYLE